MVRFSLLDLVPVREGADVADALSAAVDLAVHAERLGYHRYWVAEHHGMAGIASAATSVVLAHVGNATRNIRIGAGGIMLPNHAPLIIAEQFGTLAALFPGRVDLGLGRASGSDQRVAQAIRRTRAGGTDEFPNDVLELQAYLAGDERMGIRATPGAGEDVPLWILGSSLYGAQLAALLGLPYAFASHFAPAALDQAIAIYRRDFRPSAQLSAPHVMAAYNVFAADTAKEAELLASSMQQAFVRLRTGQPGKLQPPVAGYFDSLPVSARSMLADVLSVSSIGTQADVERDLAAFLHRTQADELMLTGQIFDPDARKHSFAIAMAAARNLESAPMVSAP
ncbi:luciferase family oxidoreductase group 1 [Sphingobium sp. OAS761]|uniref:LLM class flavin-dependent oxidoreductase n=1 Tax=Sphingobium sp. OAS761 TaxID=2817901 RepID=UPI00209D540E|nr:LLM class flavin-dependent oxidoreductase [Sphingobium sp. OAS761]MCP1471220.1 luciferase family oxidoreductase group 1 [Sphingobium sp. OAS761]